MKSVKFLSFFVLIVSTILLSTQRAFANYFIPPTRVMEVALSIYGERAIVGLKGEFHGIVLGHFNTSKFVPQQTDEPSELIALSSWLDRSGGMVVIQGEGPFFVVTLYSKEATAAMRNEVEYHRKKFAYSSGSSRWYWTFEQQFFSFTDSKIGNQQAFFPSLESKRQDNDDGNDFLSPHVLQVRRGSLLAAIGDAVRLRSNPNAVTNHGYIPHEVYVNGRLIPHEPTEGGWGYTRPNEYETFRFMKFLEESKESSSEDSSGGALLSVGTIRSSLVGTGTHFSRVAVVDVDPAVACYNNEHFKLIELIHHLGPKTTQGQRYFYLLAMEGCWSDPKIDEGFQNWMDTLDQSLSVLGTEIRALSKPYDPNHDRNSELAKMAPRDLCQGQLYEKLVKKRDFLLPKEVVNQLIRMNACNEDDRFDRALRNEVSSRWIKEQTGYRINIDRKLSRGQGDWIHSFYDDEFAKNARDLFGNDQRVTTHGIPIRYYWESDQVWERFIRLIQENRIFTVNGNLAGSQSMPSLIQAFGNAKESIKAIDISNVCDAFYLNEQEMEKMKNYFSQFSFSQNAPLFHTEKNPSVSFGWIYKTESLSSFLKGQ